ncbi:glycosyltransferase [Bradyrhizobium genosp. P]|uniref:glycosyltransferase n=1 Tax=Bradyrhizobium genosp. P TaxID=83641 RepID=UPI003CF79E3B
MHSNVSVIVPYFNESEVISATHAELDRCLGASQDFSFEIIYVDDGSRDETPTILREIRERDPRVKFDRIDALVEGGRAEFRNGRFAATPRGRSDAALILRARRVFALRESRLYFAKADPMEPA